MPVMNLSTKSIQERDILLGGQNDQLNMCYMYLSSIFAASEKHSTGIYAIFEVGLLMQRFRQLVKI